MAHHLGLGYHMWVAEGSGHLPHAASTARPRGQGRGRVREAKDAGATPAPQPGTIRVQHLARTLQDFSCLKPASPFLLGAAHKLFADVTSKPGQGPASLMPSASTLTEPVHKQPQPDTISYLLSANFNMQDSSKRGLQRKICPTSKNLKGNGFST